MAKVIFALGLAISLAILAIAVTAGPRSSGVEARETNQPSGETRAAAMTKGSCSLRQVALDQGYGISRTIIRKVCDFDD